MAAQNNQFLNEVKKLPTNIRQMLVFCTKNKCSDLFITVGELPYIYKHGVLYAGSKPVTEQDWLEFSQDAISSELNTIYVRKKFVDFSYEIRAAKGQEYRYRVNASHSQGRNGAVFRMISDRAPNFTTLNMDKNVVSLLKKAFSMKQGICMLVGPTGSGKTSTLAASITSFCGKVNSSDNAFPLKDAHLITLEDPIEYKYPSTPSTRIVQKELGEDFMSFDDGIKSALREHPTHILVGETRDVETINALVNGARTGHSMITTYHTSSVSDTIARIYSSLSATGNDLMYDLIANLNFILCQQLEKSKRGKGYVLRYQYMFFTPTIKKALVAAIEKNKNIPNTIENIINNEIFVNKGICHGWQTNDDS